MWGWGLLLKLPEALGAWRLSVFRALGPRELFGVYGRRSKAYLWLVGNGRMVVIVVIIVPHSSIPY